MAELIENLQTLENIKADIKDAINSKGVEAGDDIRVYGDKIRALTNYFYIEAVEDGAVSFEFNFDFTGNLEYSFDKVNWTNWDFYEIPLNAGQKVYFRGNNPNGLSLGYTAELIEHSNFVIPYKANVGGNIMTLIDHKGKTDVVPSHGFYRLFVDQPGIYDCSNLEFPAMTVSENCYGHMFRSAGVVYAPKVLPAKVLPESAQNCYQLMFVECSELLTVPEIMATNVVTQCMQYMFQDCSKLTHGPSILPATTLAARCYKYMFYGCSNLVSAPEIMATTLADNCCERMFRGCTSLISAPHLKATLLTTSCYLYMFQKCSKLQYIKADFTDAPTSASTSPTYQWVSSVPSTGCFIKGKDATWTNKGTYACPSGWTLITSVS